MKEIFYLQLIIVMIKNIYIYNYAENNTEK